MLNKGTTKKKTETPLDTSNKAGLQASAEKTKYVYIFTRDKMQDRIITKR